MLISVHSSKVHYDLELTRRVTVVRGNSGTGKTQLCQLVASGLKTVTIVADRTVAVVPVRKPPDISKWLDIYNGCILLIDENAVWTGTQLFWDEVMKRDIYVLVITRDTSSIKADFSINEIYELHSSGKYVTLKKYYSDKVNSKKNTGLLVTEDSKSGYKFFKLFHKKVISAKGKDNIGNFLQRYLNDCTYVIDGAAFGRLYDKLYRRALQGYIDIIAPESFEELLLKSTLFSNVRDMIDLSRANSYKTWENFYEKTLSSIMKDVGAHGYAKSELSGCFTKR